MYTRDQLDALRIALHELAEASKREARKLFDGEEMEYQYGKSFAYEAAASQVLALIESEEEVTA